MCPLTVRAYPDSTDPRDSMFSLIGYAPNQVPAERYLLTTTGALSPYDDLNDGVMVILFNETPPSTVFKNGDLAYDLTKFGSNAVVASPTPHSVSQTLNLIRAPDLGYAITNYVLFPVAIKLLSFNVVQIGGGPNLIPNPVVATPRNHLATS